jgi:uncharacterized tellurite resistance protein B-like protein
MLKVRVGRKNEISYKNEQELIESFYTIAKELLKNVDHVHRITLIDQLIEIIYQAYYSAEGEER